MSSLPVKSPAEGLFNTPADPFIFLDELTRDKLVVNQQTVIDHAFTYDAAGNPTSFAGETHTYNGNNQLLDEGIKGSDPLL